VKKVSLIIPCRNEINFIKGFFESINNQDYPKDLIEIIISDGMSDDGTFEYLKGLKNLNFILIQNKDLYVSPALNKAISISTGDFIIRLDIHCEFPSNYISSLVSYLEDKPHVGNVGLPCETLPAQPNLLSSAIAMSASSKIGVGTSSFRIGGGDKVLSVDTVPFGCWRKEIFNEIGYFDTELIRNQDDEFNQRILKANYKIHLLPGNRIKYFARPDLKSHFKMFYQYGLFKPLVNKKIGKITTWRQLAPPALIVLLFCNIFLYFLIPILSINIFLIVLVMYLTLSMIYQPKPGLRFLKIYPLFVICIIGMHAAYGLGYLKGIFFKPLSKSFSSSR